MTGAVLVLGGGVAGVQAALDLADAGVRVHLVERSPSLGGNMIRLDKTFPTNDCSACILSPLLVEAGRHPLIALHTLSELVSLEGEAGAFNARVHTRPRYVDMAACVACGDCAEKCPVRVDAEFDLGLSERRAIHIPFPQAVPLKYVIDPETCLKLTKDRCGICEKVCQAGAIDYGMEAEEVDLEVAAVVVATGYQQIDPSIRPELGHGRLPDVVTGLELERMLSASGPTGGQVRRPSDGEVPGRVAFVHCALSRDPRRGVEHCSRVCCMYLVKEAMVLREHHPGTEATMLHMDLRAYGKGYDAYLERAEGEEGTSFVRGRAAEVRQDQGGTGTPEVLVEDEEGALLAVEADLVVLGVAMVPREGTAELAATLGIELDANGFMAQERVAESTREGVFLAGCAAGPKDIPDSVSEASAAAAAAARRVAGDVEPTPAPEVPGTDPSEPPRVGVFVCRCGSNIAGVVDVEAVAEHARGLPGVVHSEINTYTCSQDSIDGIADTIRREGMNRVVVAACSPSTHEPLFRETLRTAGLDPHLFDLANIRNQCSWAHSSEPERATEKAKDLVRASVARAAGLEPLGGGTVPVVPKALVVGGGVAGMAAAVALAPHVEVTLLEREDSLGGLTGRLSTTFPDGDPGEAIVGRLLGTLEVSGANVLTGATLEGVTGYVGNFTYTADLGGRRSMEDTAGVIVLAVGAEPYEPAGGEFGRGSPRVVTNLELEDVLRDPPSGETVAFIQCVGSRNAERGCSRYCCHATLQQSRELAEAGNRVLVLHRDVRAYAGPGEAAYRAAREAGVLFARYEPEAPPEVLRDGEAIRFRDAVAGRTVEMAVDRVVLAVGLVPPEGLDGLRRELRLPSDTEGFLMERHPKLGPVETNTAGIYLAGTCQYPRPIPEAAASGAAAAMKALRLLVKGWVPTETATAEVDGDRCIGCGLCVSLCPYHAVEKGEANRASVNSALCEGCGLCAASCPVRAISVRHFSDAQLASQARALVGGGGR